MLSIHILAVLFVLAAILFYKKGNIDIKAFDKWSIVRLIVLAFVLRLAIGVIFHGFKGDLDYFYTWSTKAYEVGLPKFYDAAGADYPPGYIYVLYIIGFLHSVFNIEYWTWQSILLIKLPAIICDILTGLLIYKIAGKKNSNSRALLLTAIYLFNPAIIYNSSVWGQVDSILGFLLLLLCYLLMEKKIIPAYVVYGIGVLMKPQMIMFTPLIIFGFLEQVIFDKFSVRKLFINLLSGISVIMGMIIACIPFDVSRIFNLYTKTMSSYPYASVNAYNFWSMIGSNFKPQTERFLFMSYQSWGRIAILLTVVLAAFFFYKARKQECRYYTTAAVIIMTMFLFSVRMHERYLFYAMPLLLLAYIIRPVKGLYVAYIGVSLCQLYNMADVLMKAYSDGYTSSEGTIRIISIGMMTVGCYFYYMLYRYDVAGDTCEKDMLFTGNNEEACHIKKEKLKAYTPKPSEKFMPFTWKDAVVILAITFAYSVVALYDLGDKKAPCTEYHMNKGDSIMLNVPSDHEAKWLYSYLGNLDNREFTIAYQTNADDSWYYLGEDGAYNIASVLCWDRIELPNDCRSIYITCNSDEAILMELSFADADERGFLPDNYMDYKTLFDESNLFPDEGPSFRNGTYFDEVYYARAGYEFINGLDTYENTHPPLGKVFISISMLIFGINPFGWRIAGVLFGILMLPVIYLFGRDITKSRYLGSLTTVLFAFDFMHFTQTRIATIDVFVTFFIILMYWLMYRYSKTSFYDTKLSKTFVLLLLCGTAMGFAIACKWTGIYAAIGLAVIFFATIYRRYKEYVLAKENPNGSSHGISNSSIIDTFAPNTYKTIRFCILAFAIIPIIIYTLSYLPFRHGDDGLITRMLNNQVNMFSYHSGLTETHAYSSAWYEWPTMVRPVLYYWRGYGEGYVNRASISAFGNPLIWWVGIPAFLFMIYLVIKKKDKQAAFLCIGYLSQYVPWIFISRCTFLYHYFTSVPFIVLMIIYSFKRIKERMSDRSWYILTSCYVVATIALFIMFYPVLSGQTVSAEYVNKFLKLFSTWVF